MKNIFFILGALVASCVAETPRSCGAPEPTDEQIALAKSLYVMEKEARVAGNYSALAQTIEINVYFHVLSTSNAVADGYISVRKSRPNTYFNFFKCANICYRRALSQTSWMP